jgi:hypothetical protein
MTYEEITDKTTEIVNSGNYKVGDTFQEMYHFWLYIVNVDGDKVTTIEGTPSSRNSLLGFNLNVYTKEELSNKLRYNSSTDRCWIDYLNNDVTNTLNLFTKYKKQVNESGDVGKIRDMNINLTLS